MIQTVRINFLTSNNEAKYEAILVGLDLALALMATKVKVRSDSQLVAGQIQWEYDARDECIACYFTLVDAQIEKLEGWSIKSTIRLDKLWHIVPIFKAIIGPLWRRM